MSFLLDLVRVQHFLSETDQIGLSILFSSTVLDESVHWIIYLITALEENMDNSKAKVRSGAVEQ